MSLIRYPKPGALLQAKTQAEYLADSSIDHSYFELDPLIAEAPTGLATKPSTLEFFTRILDSRLLSTQELEAFLLRHPGMTEENSDEFLSRLVGEGALTEYQAQRLVCGHFAGLVFGNYRILDRLGAGGMGVVYKAEHVRMRRVVAIKVLLPLEGNQRQMLDRFYNEIHAIAALQHTNIVHAYDAGEVDLGRAGGQPLRYLVMEFVPGKNLEQLVYEQGPLPITQAVDLAIQAASGLQHAHEQGLVHRDVKPSNLLLSESGTLKLVDFGVARLGRKRHTEHRTMLGSIDYMAPEQARDARTADIRADIYGLGGTLCWMLTGKKPFPGDRPLIEELVLRQRPEPVPLQCERPEIPDRLVAIVRRMMAIEPANRFATPRALIEELRDFAQTSSGASADTILDSQLSHAAQSTADHQHAEEMLIHALTRMTEMRSIESKGHLARMQSYVRVLAEEARRIPALEKQLDDVFIHRLERSVVLHDVGKMATPDHILHKPGKLDCEERSVIESHTTDGANLIDSVVHHNRGRSQLLHMASEIAHWHHERYDGKGYPDGLAGNQIPLCARIVALADVYDALRSKLVYKPGLTHQAAKRLIVESTPHHFDPDLLAVFRLIDSAWDEIFNRIRE